jgi:hypothetical protein
MTKRQYLFSWRQKSPCITFNALFSSDLLTTKLTFLPVTVLLNKIGTILFLSMPCRAYETYLNPDLLLKLQKRCQQL